MLDAGFCLLSPVSCLLSRSLLTSPRFISFPVPRTNSALPAPLAALTPPAAAEPALVINPLLHPAWDSQLAGQRDSSFFHTTAWAHVLHDTYGHRPFYLCSFATGQLELLPLMEVSSRWIGRRGVSLPFTDFCPPLKALGYDHRAIYLRAIALGRERHWHYLECRSSDYEFLGAAPSLVFFGHELDLERRPDDLFQGLEGAVRRGIRKAENAGLQVDFSDSLEAVRTFYALHCRTRRRHGLPPQPFAFFENIAWHVLRRGHGFVATARLGAWPLAAAIFFHYGRQAIYKSGASDYAFQHLRPNNLVMWEAIKRCAHNGCTRLHLGRTSLAHEGLRRFKLGFGAHEERIAYYKYDFRQGAFVTDVDRTAGWFNLVFRCLPAPLLRLAGRMLYPHLS